MKRFKRIVVIALAAVIFTTMFTGCFVNKLRLNGTWEEVNGDTVITFSKDGKGTMTIFGVDTDFNYTVKGDTINMEIGFLKVEQEFEYKFKWKTLILTIEGESLEFRRK